MKLKLLIILFLSSIAFAQVKPIDKKADKDSTEYKQLELKVNQTKYQIKELQSNLYEAEKQLEILYKDFTLYSNLLKVKKELIDSKEKKK